MAENTINLAVAFDENYLVPFYVLLTSVFRHNKQYQIRLHVIASAIDLDEQKQIENYVSLNRSEIIFYDVDTNFIEDFAVSNDPRYPISVYFRLFFPYLIDKNVEKILYLDIDTIVIGSLRELYFLTFDTPVAAATDGENIRPGIHQKEVQFNSGVMLIDLERWRAMDITKNVIKFLVDYPEKAPYHDQDALNAILGDLWHKIGNKYNLTFRDIPDLQFEAHALFLEDKIIIHYNENIKPWSIFCTHPFKHLYDQFFLIFSRSKRGEYLLKTHIDMQIKSLIIAFSSESDSDLESILLFAFALHLGWMKSVDLSQVLIRKQLKDYYGHKFGSGYPNGADKPFKKEFDLNKDILSEIFNEIASLGYTKQNSNQGWLEKWIVFCKHINESTRFSDDKYLLEIPELINKKLEITEVLKSLLFSFIYEFI